MKTSRGYLARRRGFEQWDRLPPVPRRRPDCLPPACGEPEERQSGVRERQVTAEAEEIAKRRKVRATLPVRVAGRGVRVVASVAIGMMVIDRAVAGIDEKLEKGMRVRFIRARLHLDRKERQSADHDKGGDSCSWSGPLPANR
jgi:hypothetical protein